MPLYVLQSGDGKVVGVMDDAAHAKAFLVGATAGTTPAGWVVVVPGTNVVNGYGFQCCVEASDIREEEA